VGSDISYSITARGRAVLRGPAALGLSPHARDLLALCDPQVSVEQARQFMPPESLQSALYSLRELELVEGPPVALRTPTAAGFIAPRDAGTKTSTRP